MVETPTKSDDADETIKPFAAIVPAILGRFATDR
jgi:hypothetical protein